MISGKLTPVKVKTAYLTPAAASANQQIVAAVATKEIYLIAAIVCSQNTTATTMSFKNGSGGSVALFLPVPPNNVADGNPFAMLPENKSGWLNTSINTALVVDVGAGAGVGITIRYVEITPYQ